MADGLVRETIPQEDIRSPLALLYIRRASPVPIWVVSREILAGGRGSRARKQYRRGGGVMSPFALFYIRSASPVRTWVVSRGCSLPPAYTYNNIDLYIYIFTYINK